MQALAIANYLLTWYTSVEKYKLQVNKNKINLSTFCGKERNGGKRKRGKRGVGGRAWYIIFYVNLLVFRRNDWTASVIPRFIWVEYKFSGLNPNKRTLVFSFLDSPEKVHIWVPTKSNKIFCIDWYFKQSSRICCAFFCLAPQLSHLGEAVKPKQKEWAFKKKKRSSLMQVKCLLPCLPHGTAWRDSDPDSK